MSEAYPLKWPDGWKRTPTYSIRRSKFKTSFVSARDQLMKQAKLFGGSGLIISTNIPLRLDGIPKAGYAQPKDAGVAVYFKKSGKAMTFCCDRWDRIEDNIHAISMTIEAIRGIERWGSSDLLERAFQGFTALPGAVEQQPTDCWSVLGIGRTRDVVVINNAYRAQAKKYHPDVGDFPDGQKMRMINEAKDVAIRWAQSSQ